MDLTLRTHKEKHPIKTKLGSHKARKLILLNYYRKLLFAVVPLGLYHLLFNSNMYFGSIFVLEVKFCIMCQQVSLITDSVQKSLMACVCMGGWVIF